MIETAFFDTNILVYAHDKREPSKRQIAGGILGRYFSERRGALSTQVLQEFFVTITHKAARLSLPAAKALLGDYLRFHVVTIAPLHILNAIDLQERFRLSFWDALILASAKAAGATVLFTEDLSHGRTYDGVQVRNPFVFRDMVDKQQRH